MPPHAPNPPPKKFQLVIAISSRALFNLEKENHIFEKKGLLTYRKFQIQNEKKILPIGGAFFLIKSFLLLNKLYKKNLVQVIILSKNSYEMAVRIFNSVAHYKLNSLNLSQAAFLSGDSISNYLQAFNVDLFLSKSTTDVKSALLKQTAAAITYDLPNAPLPQFYKNTFPQSQIRIAFDADGVIFSPHSHFIFQKKGLQAFQNHEKQFANQLLPNGPFASFLKKIARLQKSLLSNNPNQSPQKSPIVIALITARNSPAHERVVRTLRKFQIPVDKVFFLGAIPKKNVLNVFKPHIFFDDQLANVKNSSHNALSPAAQVPLPPS